MKQLAIIGIVLIAAAAGTPVLVGTMAQSRVTEQAGLVSENELFAVTVRDYDRGWLTSNARVDVGLSEAYRERLAQALAESQDAPASVPEIEAMLGRTVTLALELSHGPLLTAGGLHAGFASSVIRLDPQTEGLDKLLAKLGIPFLFEIRTRSGFSGMSSFEAEVPPMVFEGPNGTFSHSGLTAEGSYDFVDRHIVSDGRLDTFEVTSPFTTVTAQRLTLRGDARMISAYLWEGPIELGLEQMTIRNSAPDGPALIEVSNLGFSARTALDEGGERLDMNAAYHVDSVTGEEISLTNARFDIAMRALDVAALEAYNRITQELMFQTDDMELLLPALQDSFYGLLAAEPSVDFGPLVFNWNGDPFQAVVRIRTDTEMLPPQVAFSLVDPSLLTRIFAVEAQLDVARPIAERLAIEAARYQLGRSGGDGGEILAPDDLDALARVQGPGMLLLLAAQGMIQESETGYRAEVAFERGILDVNGREIPLGPQF